MTVDNSHVPVLLLHQQKKQKSRILLRNMFSSRLLI